MGRFVVGMISIMLFATIIITIDPVTSVKYGLRENLLKSEASFLGEDSGDYSGRTVAKAGDVNGDGYDDFLISAISDEEGGSLSGQTYLIFGMKNGWSSNLSLSNANASFLGGEYDSSGRSLSGGGDVNGDGFDDFLIGTSDNDDGGLDAGQVYLILGKSSGWSMDTPLSNADASFIGEAKQDEAGISISCEGDVNGDGYDDIIIGADGNDDGGANAGQTYLILGKASGWSMDTDLSSADASFIGENTYDNSGKCVDSSGDVNGDGYDDILIGAHLNDEKELNSGQTYLIFGKATGWSMNTPLSNANASFWGEGASDFSGSSVSGAGDVNGDGFDDILIGAYWNSEGGQKAGQSYLILGKALNWAMDTPLSSSNASFIGEVAYANSGSSLDIADDVNYDGFDDILIGAYGDNYGGTSCGQTYLILGKSSGWSMDVQLSKANSSFVGENAGDYSGYSISGVGDVNGDRYNDILIGSYRYSKNGTDAGKTYLIFYMKNSAPMIVTKDQVFIDEDNEYSIYYSAIDIDPTEDVLNWKFSTNSSWINFNYTYYHLYGKPLNKDVGSWWVNLSVDDGNGGLDWTNFTIIVNNTNDDPFITSQSIPDAVEDKLYEITLIGEDVDPTNDVLNWSLKTNSGFIGIDSQTGILSGTPSNADVGVWWVLVNVSDGNGGFNDTNLSLNVQNINDNPVIEPISLGEVYEDIEFFYYVVAIDIDPTYDELEWKMKTDATFLNIDQDTGNLSGIPANDDVGDWWILINVSDGKMGYDEINFTLTVLNVNDDPAILTDSLGDATEDIEYWVNLKAYDIDPTDDELTWSIYDTNARFLNISSDDGNLSGIPTNYDVGFFWINISVNDGKGGIQNVNLTLSVQNVNDDPVIDTQELPDAIEDMEYYYMMTGYDIDPTGDELFWSIDTTDANFLTIRSDTGNLSGIPANDDVGTWSVRINVSDGNGGFDVKNFVIVVTGRNDRPELNITSLSLVSKEDEMIRVHLNDVFKDIDKDVLSFSYIASYNFSISITDGIAIIVPKADWSGEEKILFTATDGEFPISINATIKVDPVNDPPKDASITAKSSYIEGENQTVIGSAFDPDIKYSDRLTFSWSSNISGMIGTGEEINLSLSSGHHRIILNVSDATGAFIIVSKEIEILPKNVEEITDSDDDHQGFPWWILILLCLAIILICIVIFIIIRNRKTDNNLQESIEIDDEIIQKQTESTENTQELEE